ncbi:hypothetical protein [Kitasatospora sp. NPDC097643]|uniref:hypothetical protein n=1 Tax=Kitasatospora sp. NPDC097643 TaxID=3157230 RepID=UPI00331AF671
MRFQLRYTTVALLCAGVLAGLAGLTGCDSGSGSGSGAAPAVKLTPPPLEGATAPPTGRDGMLGLPLSALGSGGSGGQAGDVREGATRVLVAKCMHTAGYAAFTQEEAVGSRGPVDNTTAMPAGAFGYLPESVAAVRGFHGPKPVAVPPPRRVVTGAEESALQECVRSTAARLAPPDQGGSELVGRLFGEAQAALDKDTRVRDAGQAWTGCMAGAGFPDVTPSGLVDRYRATAGTTPDPGPEELAAARADAACTTSTNLAGIWFTALAGYQKQLVAANEQGLAEYRKRYQEYQAQLARIVAEA